MLLKLSCLCSAGVVRSEVPSCGFNTSACENVARLKEIRQQLLNCLWRVSILQSAFAGWGIGAAGCRLIILAPFSSSCQFDSKIPPSRRVTCCTFVSTPCLQTESSALHLESSALHLAEVQPGSSCQISCQEPFMGPSVIATCPSTTLGPNPVDAEPLLVRPARHSSAIGFAQAASFGVCAQEY